MSDIKDEKACFEKYRDFDLSASDLWCNATWDMVLCWPPTPASGIATLNCPSLKGVDPTQLVYKHCDVSGLWAGKVPGDFSLPQGWTNYTPCFTPEIRKLMSQLYAGSKEDVPLKMSIATGTRILEFIGLTTSLASLIVSLMIFTRFRKLKNNRTKVHINLFAAMVIQVVIRLTLYIDQAIIRGHPGESKSLNDSSKHGIENTPILCESSYILLEYARTAMFMWMFIEGLYLHSRITVTVFQHNFYYVAYCAVGWGVPILMTAAWATATALLYGSSRCWWGYNFTGYFWILEGPRLGVITTNLIFLLNIIRVLVTKLRASNSSEAKQVRKAVKAAIILLPLLGITNMVNMIAAPLGRSAWEFGIWSFATHFLTSFQGFFVALIYCFINGEVREAIRLSLRNYFLHRTAGGRRDSFIASHFMSTVSDAGRPSRSQRLSSLPTEQEKTQKIPLL